MPTETTVTTDKDPRGVQGIIKNLPDTDDTIAAISTPPGAGGIGIIRVSGKKCLTLFYSLFNFKKPVNEPVSHKLYYANVIDPAIQTIVDEALVVYMKSPHTYTREDILEIQCHSSYAVLKKIMEILLINGVRPANPGEFTYRAFINGRIDLSQAESLIDLINSQTAYENKNALNILQGVLLTKMEEIRRSSLHILSAFEANIDFSDDVLDTDYANYIDVLEKDILMPLYELVNDYKNTRVLREGAVIAIAGRPNVGKSSIFNALLGMGRVIVSPVPGTTRDVIKESMELNGLRITLVDTAGIRDLTHDPIEKLGVDMARDEIDRADLVAFVVDITDPFNDEDMAVFKEIKRDMPVICVLNKRDLVDTSADKIISDVRERLLKLLQIDFINFIPMSAKNGYGLDKLKQGISDILVSPELVVENVNIILNVRQKHLVENAINACKNAILGLKEQKFQELICIDLREIIGSIDAITGNNIEDDVLEEIFSNFCIGK
jgi:tRNA modification GTPase